MGACSPSVTSHSSPTWEIAAADLARQFSSLVLKECELRSVQSRWATLASGIVAIAAAGLVACQAGGRAGSTQVETHSVEYLAYNIDRHKGQMIRTCGALVVQDGQWRVEGEPSAQLGTLHGRPAVLIASCPNGAPSLDAQRCIRGRVARRGGSLSYPLGRSVAVDDVPTNYEWFLHARCPSRR